MRLTTFDLEKFDRDGYLLVRDVLDWRKDLQPVLEEYERVLDDLLEQWCAEGRLTSTYPDLPFGERLTTAVAEDTLEVSGTVRETRVDGDAGVVECDVAVTKQSGEQVVAGSAIVQLPL